MTRPTRRLIDGDVDNPNTFQAARQSLVANGLQHLQTSAVTLFAAEAHIPGKGNHIGQECIWIKNENGSVAYIFESCRGM